MDEIRETSSLTNQVWGSSLIYVVCEQCDWVFALPKTLLTDPIEGHRCPHCFHKQIALIDEHTKEITQLEPPELILPFLIPHPKLIASLQRFARGIRFSPRDLTEANLQARLQRIFLPTWLVDIDVTATWQAEVGFDYDVRSHEGRYTDHQGWQTQEVTEVRIRWEPRLGRLERRFHNVATPALDEDKKIQNLLGRFDLGGAQAYQIEDAQRAFFRAPNRPLEDAWSSAIPALQSSAAELCRRAASGDHIREFRWSPSYNHQNWTSLLLPVYSSYYLDDEGQPQALLIHGQTGELYGHRRASKKRAERITFTLLAIAGIFFTLGLLTGVAGILLPALFLPAGIILFVSIAFALLSSIPMIMVWQFNRAQERYAVGN
jgi:hypothetical protein